MGRKFSLGDDYNSVYAEFDFVWLEYYMLDFRFREILVSLLCRNQMLCKNIIRDCIFNKLISDYFNEWLYSVMV